MKRIINGKRYDTETADLIGEGGNNRSVTDFPWMTESLYRTKRSRRFFLAGKGNAMSKYAEPAPGGGRQGGEGIIPLDDDDALAWAERHLSAETIEKYFDIEDA